MTDAKEGDRLKMKTRRDGEGVEMTKEETSCELREVNSSACVLFVIVTREEDKTAKKTTASTPPS
jgi:hypothetical protein